MLRLFQRDVELLQHAFVLLALAVLGRPAAGQLPVSAGRKIFQRLDVVLCQRFQHLRGQPFEIDQAVVHAQRHGSFQRLPVRGFQIVAGARLQLGRRGFIKAINRQQFIQIDVSHFFQVGEPFGHQKLRHHLVDIQRLDEQVGALGELGLAARAFVRFGHDVDVQPGQLAGQTHVLPAPADRQRQLFIRHHHFDLAGFFVDHNLADFRRLQGVDKERGLILVPRNNVDLFALQFVDHRLNPAAAHPHAGPDRIDGVVIGNHGNLRPAARITGHGLDLDDAIVDLGNFHLEQLGHEFRRGARQENLRSARLAPYILDIGPDTVADPVAFAADLLVPAQNGLAAPVQVDDDVAIFLALDHAVKDLALAVLELFELAVTLGFAHLLQDHLLGALRGDAAQINGGNLINHLVADLGIGKKGFGLRHGQLRLIILNAVVFHHGPDARKAGAARLAVDLYPDIQLCPIARLGRTGERILHRLDHQVGVNHLLAGNRFGGLQKFKLVGRGNRHVGAPRGWSVFRHRRAKAVFGLVCAFGFVNLVKLGLVLDPAGFALTQHLGNQVFRQDQLGIGQPVKLQPDGQGRAGFLDLDQNLVAFGSAQHALEPAASVDQLAGFHPRLVIGPDIEILQPRQRAVNAGRRHFQRIIVFNGVFHIQHCRNGGRDARAFVHDDAALGPVGHDLQGRRAPAHQTDADQFESQAFDDRLNNPRQAAVYGGFRDKIGHGCSRK